MYKQIKYSILPFVIFLFMAFEKTDAQTIMHVDSSLNIQAGSLIATDVDGDGLIDIAGIASTTFLVWYKNLGDSIAQIPFTFPTDDWIGMLRSADMDGDGDMDFVIGDYYNDYIDWIENIDGTGTLLYQHTISVGWIGAGPRSIDLCDINNDGYIDIVSNMGTSNLLLYINSGAIDPFFSQQLVDIGVSDPYYISVVDMDNDDDLDIIYYSKTLYQIIYRENSGDGVFINPGVAIIYEGSVLSLKLTDMELDGDFDVLIGYDYLAGNPALKLYQNDGGAFALSQSWDFTHDVVGIATAHFNSDSLPDIVALFSDYSLGFDDISLNEINVFINTDNLTFTSPIIPLEGIIPSPYNYKVASAALADFDLNGTDDLVISDYNMLLVAYSSDTSDQIFQNYQEVFRPRSTVFAVATIQIADSTSYATLLIDNHLDVYQYTNELDEIIYKRTIEQRGINYNTYSKAYATIVFDIDNDGFKDDLFTSGGIMYEEEYGEYQWNVYRNVTQNEIDKHTANTSYNCLNPIVADVNNDGFLDIIAADGQLFWEGIDYDGFDIYDERNAYFWLKNIDGSGNFDYLPLPGDYYDDEGFPIATDVDFDGDLDVLTFNQISDNLYCYYNMDGAGAFGERIALANIANGQFISPRDVDGDGMEDIVINTSGDLIQWLQHTGPNIYAAPKIMCYLAKVRNPERLKFADTNGDGFDDLITGTVNTQIYLNSHGFGFYPYPVVYLFNYNNRSVVDLNHNGVIEIAGIYNTNYAYSRELEPLPVLPIIQFTNYATNLDEDQLLADTLFIAISEIPTDTLLFNIFATSLAGSEFEVQLYDGASDTIQLLFLPDSTALINQQIIIRAIDDDEVDGIENGSIAYSLNNLEGDFPLAALISRVYTIIDNDDIVTDAESNLTINCDDSLLHEGTFGTACTIKLNLTVEYPVNIEVITDNQLDVGVGTQDTISLQLTAFDVNYVFYVDAIDDDIEEGLHFGELTFNTYSEDDNYDDVSNIIKSFSLSDTTAINPEEPQQPELPLFNAWYIPETNAISLQYNLYEDDAILNLLNNIGEVVAKIQLKSAKGETTISTINLPEGYYYLMIASTHNRFTLGKTLVIY